MIKKTLIILIVLLKIKGIFGGWIWRNQIVILKWLTFINGFIKKYKIIKKMKKLQGTLITIIKWKVQLKFPQENL